MPLGLSLGIGSSLSAGGWSPLSLFAAGEQGAWYDPSDFSTMFQDSAGTTPVTAVEQPVGKILDKSGRGNHATQATTAQKPTLKQDGAGKYYLLFDGVDDGLVTSSIDFTATDKMTVIAGVRKLSDAAAGIIAESSVNYTSAGGYALFAPAGASATYQMGQTGATGAGTNTSPASYSSPITSVVTGAYNIGVLGYGGMAMRVQGAAVAPTYAGAGVTTVGTFRNDVLNIGRRAGGGLPFSGHIYSLIVRGAATADVTAVEAYVAVKTGVTL